MPYAALATDYDGTIAHDGVIDDATVAALQHLREAQRHLILVTGRELADLERICPRLDLFTKIVAENGAVIRDADGTVTVLCDPPSEAFVARLRADHVAPLAVGQAIVATWEPNETAVLAAIRDLGLDLQITFNKGAVMVLPPGVNKASGLKRALRDLHLSALDCVAVGDAENDLAFLEIAGVAVAVANALDTVKARAAFVTEGARGAGVAELIARMLDDDLQGADAHAPAQYVALAQVAQGEPPLCLLPRRETFLLTGASGGGKSTLTLGLLERLIAGGFQVCVIDPEGDYEDSLPGITGIGSANTEPEPGKVLDALRDPGANVVVNLLAIAVADRPAFLGKLLPGLLALRVETARPHVVVVDEAHHMLPTGYDPGGTLLPAELRGFGFITVHPDRLAERVLECVETLVVVGANPDASVAAFCAARQIRTPDAPSTLTAGEALVFRPATGELRLARVLPHAGTRRRHLRKYAEGELGEDKSFYFRGPGNALNLRAQNLMLFLQIGDGVDLATWEFHRAQGDYSHWISDSIKDEDLAREVAGIEQDGSDTGVARGKVREAIAARYTGPG